MPNTLLLTFESNWLTAFLTSSALEIVTAALSPPPVLSKIPLPWASIAWRYVCPTKPARSIVRSAPRGRSTASSGPMRRQQRRFLSAEAQRTWPASKNNQHSRSLFVSGARWFIWSLRILIGPPRMSKSVFTDWVASVDPAFGCCAGAPRNLALAQNDRNSPPETASSKIAYALELLQGRCHLN